MWLAQREAILRQLRSLHLRAEALVHDLEIIDEAIAKSRTSPRSTKYVKCGEPIETRCGWRGGADDLRYSLEASVDYHTRRQGQTKNLIKLRNGLVGLNEWIALAKLPTLGLRSSPNENCHQFTAARLSPGLQPRSGMA
jgi:hypothetical protein